MATQPEGALPLDIASDKSYLKDYNKVLVFRWAAHQAKGDAFSQDSKKA